MEDQLLIQTSTFQLSQIEFLVRMLVSVGIGLVVGLERAFAGASEEGHPNE
ncbi:MAG: putative membrane protein YhiD involved in acid resistance [Bacteroidia bacterium]|jgi:uncharacterized membrane protein YhiD involved in acid resistance